MPEYAQMNKILNVPWVLNMPKLWTWKSSEYCKVLNIQALHSVLNMPENTLTEFWIYLGFYICQYSGCSRAVNMQVLHRVLIMSQCCLICLSATGIWLNMSEYNRNMPEYIWIYDNRQVSEYISYNT